MSDVRLTATNPDDSSVVPVACNSRGELLITEPVIETIPNDVTIEGSLKVSPPPDLNSANVTFYPVIGNNDWLVGGLCHHTAYSVTLLANGYRNSANEWTSCEINGSTSAAALEIRTSSALFVFRAAENWPTGSSFNMPSVFQIDANGPTSRSLILRPDGLEKSGGKVIDVAEELQFLRAQVQAVMERLKMAPEGGWPVWDGSD